MYFLLLELFGLGEMPHLKKYKCASNDVHACVLEVWYRGFRPIFLYQHTCRSVNVTYSHSGGARVISARGQDNVLAPLASLLK